jgi:hypothetical protein
MSNLKHVGRLVKSKRRVVVAYRVVPGEPDNCIVVASETLNSDEHDTLMNAVESEAGQQANEMADVMSRTVLPDGRPMLAAFHTTGKLMKMPTTEIELVPNRTTTILLSELNNLIAQQKGVTLEELAMKPTSNPQEKETSTEQPVAETTQNEVLTDDELAASYRSQADALFKEAKKLREQAEDLVPTKKKRKAEEVSD